MRTMKPNSLATQEKETMMSVPQTTLAARPRTSTTQARNLGPRSRAARPAPRRKKSPADDRQIIERLKAGDHAALEAIFNLYSGKLYGVAQRILGNSADSEEVIQDVFWTVYRKANTFKGDSKFSTWLY